MNKSETVQWYALHKLMKTYQIDFSLHKCTSVPVNSKFKFEQASIYKNSAEGNVARDTNSFPPPWITLLVYTAFWF